MKLKLGAGSSASDGRKESDAAAFGEHRRAIVDYPAVDDDKVYLLFKQPEMSNQIANRRFIWSLNVKRRSDGCVRDLVSKRRVEPDLNPHFSAPLPASGSPVPGLGSKYHL